MQTRLRHLVRDGVCAKCEQISEQALPRSRGLPLIPLSLLPPLPVFPTASIATLSLPDLHCYSFPTATIRHRRLLARSRSGGLVAVVVVDSHTVTIAIVTRPRADPRVRSNVVRYVIASRLRRCGIKKSIVFKTLLNTL